MNDDDDDDDEGDIFISIINNKNKNKNENEKTTQPTSYWAIWSFVNQMQVIKFIYM